MAVGVAAFTLEPSQPHGSCRVADNAFHHRLNKGFKALNIGFLIIFNRLANAIKFLLDTQVGEGGDAQFR